MPAAPSSATCCAGSSKPAGSASRASTTSTTRAARSTSSVRRWSRCGAASPCPRRATTARTSRSSRAPCPTMSGTRRRTTGRTQLGSSATGQPAACGPGSRPAWSASASTSTSGRRRARSTPRAGWSGPSSGCAIGGHVFEQDGAIWFRSTTFGDDKDRVIIRSNGEPTYFAADIGYVTEKFSRGFDHLIYIWGADHHGTVARVRNAAGGDGLRPRRGPGPALQLGAVRPRRRRGLDVEAGRRVRHARRAAGRGRRRRRPLVVRLTRRHHRDRLRHRAGEEAVGREPRLLRPVRPRPDRVDPAQGERGRVGARRAP